MSVKSGSEIVRLHKEFEERISEVSSAVAKLDDYNYTKNLLHEQLDKLRDELKKLEDTRFQAMDPIIIHTSLLGGKTQGSYHS
ncbi:hypothetical protein P22_0848 [Propionispora sp. 2/2-37]|uniref:hypothetical protein n=1 Tax=Propionispora sp. 2/2-37 TaxID=1677858 RepID=UPI0006BB6727|nr:hypothetical protein [Propionispora sp. 2/2-37]CUH94782.1 hypothetical protein P22_0848 [Propionispora sp. 2/2-37]